MSELYAAGAALELVRLLSFLRCASLLTGVSSHVLTISQLPHNLPPTSLTMSSPHCHRRVHSRWQCSTPIGSRSFHPDRSITHFAGLLTRTTTRAIHP
jgi:hypothetical protein